MRKPRPFICPQKMGHQARVRHAKNRAIAGMIRAREIAPAILAGTTGCRWIEADPREPSAKWCGCRRVPWRSWCAEHLRRVYAVMI